MNLKTIVIAICVLGIQQNTYAQGCSDAGVCTAGSYSRNTSGEDRKYALSFNYIFGSGEQGTVIHTAQLQLDAALPLGLNVQIKVPYIFTNGNLGTSLGLGDIIAVVSKKKNIGKFSFEPAIGARIASGTGNDSKDNMNLVLPMPYQTSLGTNDLLANVTMRIKTWNFTLGYQHPFGKTKNEFNPALWAATEAKNYFPAYHLQRKPDVVLRVDKAFTYKKLSIKPGTLFIYKIANESMDFNYGTNPENVKEISGSAGLTWNVLVECKYAITERMKLAFGAAMPLVVRKNRPDGLTRALVANVGISFSF